jgi:hypothetical protein
MVKDHHLRFSITTNPPRTTEKRGKTWIGKCLLCPRSRLTLPASLCLFDDSTVTASREMMDVNTALNLGKQHEQSDTLVLQDLERQMGDLSRISHRDGGVGGKRRRKATPVTGCRSDSVESVDRAAKHRRKKWLGLSPLHLFPRRPGQSLGIRK